MCEILHRIKIYIDYKNISVTAFEKSVGMSNGAFSKQLRNKGAIGTDKLENILSVYHDLSPIWLLTGAGSMTQSNNNGNKIDGCFQNINSTTDSINQGQPHGVLNNLPTSNYKSPGAIPLVSEKAVGGFTGKDLSISEHDIIAYYVIPKFRFLEVDFMIEVIGDSMMPRLFPGDIIACSIINNPQFIQWNKPHLLATRDQGLIVKRLKRSDKSDCLLAISDNKEYEPFDIPIGEIAGMARVVGVIHAE